MGKVTTLSEFILDRQKDFPYATGELSRLLESISLAAKLIQREVSKAGLTEDILGAVGGRNIQGEEQQKLDVYANDIFIECMKAQREFCGVGSEEMDDFITTDQGFNPEGKYVLLMDPLDGSSNIDVNVSIGTIFSIYHRISDTGSPCTLDDFLQPGRKQIAAGYVVYGSSTMLVYTTGNGTNGFTLDPSIGEFCLSHPDIRTPQTGKIYSVNEGNREGFSQGIRDYIEYCQNKSNDCGKAYSARYIGSLIADFHRNMLKGGIYLYPRTPDAPEGKLRLLYEANPLAWIIEQAGGKATDGEKNILDIQPYELHQRTPLVIGSPDMVDRVHSMVQNAREKVN